MFQKNTTCPDLSGNNNEQTTCEFPAFVVGQELVENADGRDTVKPPTSQ